MNVAPAVVIRAAALRHNLKRVRELAPGCPVLAVIKANGYGHGLLAVAEMLDTADGLAVARLEGALKLRKAGIGRRIVVFSGASTLEELKEAAEHHLDVVVHSPAQVALLEGSRVTLDVWLKVDSGMGRLGVAPEAAPTLLQRLQSRAGGGTIRLMTHLASADDPDPAQTDAQMAVFRTLSEDWEGDISIANSAAILRGRIAAGPMPGVVPAANWVRPGLMLYGASPLADQTAAELGLRPVMSFETRLLAVKRLPRGHRVGYGGEWQAGRDSVIGVAAVGYADGYPWHTPRDTTVLVNGHRAPVIGRVSMDMISIDLTGIAGVSPGDRVVLWGDGLPVEEVAGNVGTIAWELLTGVGSRVLRRTAG